MSGRIRKALATGSGMWGIWDSSYFPAIKDYATWERELLEDSLKDSDILRHVRAGQFVPINIGSDGVFEFEVRVGSSDSPTRLDPRERQFLIVASDPYRFNSKGELNASGIEAVGAVPGEDVASLKVLPGAYSILVHLIGWDREPGAKDGRGRPTSNALPDFVVLANPTVSGNDPFRTELRTFKK
jgi:hypothetical protein